MMEEAVGELNGLILTTYDRQRGTAFYELFPPGYPSHETRAFVFFCCTKRGKVDKGRLIAGVVE